MRVKCSSRIARADTRPAATSAAIDATVGKSFMETTRRRNAESTIFGRGCHRENLVAIEAWLLDIGAQHVDERVRLRHRLDIRKIEVVDVGKVIEHAIELARVTLDLLGRNVETGEACNLRHVGGGETL
jgi:hypothetical protein